jgi:hypothetical protein
MNELERINTGITSSLPVKKTGLLSNVEVYDQYGPLAYGIILQIVPQPHLAQEILVNVFSSPLLQACNSYPFTFAVCVIKLARQKAVEAKRRVSEMMPIVENGGKVTDVSPEAIFDLSFRQGYTPDEIAERLQITKAEVLKAIHVFFKASKNK